MASALLKLESHPPSGWLFVPRKSAELPQGEKIVQLNEELVRGQIKELVRSSVEETLNELLEKEAESLTQAARYERC